MAFIWLEFPNWIVCQTENVCNLGHPITGLKNRFKPFYQQKIKLK